MVDMTTLPAQLRATESRSKRELLDAAADEIESLTMLLNEALDFIRKLKHRLDAQISVGDTIYEADGVRVYESVVKNIIYDTTSIAFDLNALGKSVFLTREKAEKAIELPEVRE